MKDRKLIALALRALRYRREHDLIFWRQNAAEIAAMAAKRTSDDPAYVQRLRNDWEEAEAKWGKAIREMDGMLETLATMQAKTREGIFAKARALLAANYSDMDPSNYELWVLALSIAKDVAALGVAETVVSSHRRVRVA